jgi:phosphoserine phosphatase
VSPAPKFASVVIDVDSTLCGIEGIDVLASRRGPEIGAAIAAVTERAMNGELPLEAVYGKRLELIRPTKDDIRVLADAYAASVAPDASSVIARLRSHGVRLELVSGGIRQAIAPVAKALGFSGSEVSAVSLVFNGAGDYEGYDSSSPLTKQFGKREVVAALALPRPTLAMGDGSTDIAMRDSADAFAAYVGFTRRENVVAAADYVVFSFAELAELVLDAPSERR